MEDNLDVLDGNRPAEESSAVAQFVAWLLRMIRSKPEALAGYAEQLKGSFESGLAVIHPNEGKWFATLDEFHAEDNQVAALVRLSQSRPLKRREVREGSLNIGERDRTLFSEQPNRSADTNLLLRYSFPTILPLDRNLRLFTEFAMNELGRLRPVRSL